MPPTCGRTTSTNISTSFTLDSRDLNANVDAWSVYTTLEYPYVDYDDDNGDLKDDEAEVVAEDPPNANTYYLTSTYWSHSYLNGCCWQYDSGGGSIGFWENLSETYVLGDKYNTHCCNAPLNLNIAYPYKPMGAAASASTDAPAQSSRTSDRWYSAAVGDTPADIHLRLDLGNGVDAYARAARALAASTIEGGPSRGVVTFSRPLAWEELKSIEALGLVIGELEVATAPDNDGQRGTFFVPNESASEPFVKQEAARLGVAVLGIVSADIQVPNPDSLHRGEASPLVYLIDLSITDYKRSNPTATDVRHNDVFWPLAGWVSAPQ